MRFLRMRIFPVSVAFSAALPLAASMAATAATFALVWLVAPSGSYLYDFFFDRSWIQYASTFCFWAVMAILIGKYLQFRLEREAYETARAVLDAPPFGTGQSSLIWADACHSRQEFIAPAKLQYANSIVFLRIVHALSRLEKTQSTNAMQEYCRTRSELDAGALDTSYSDVRFLLWLIPTLGFIGTVMGIGLAIAGFSEVISSASDFNAVRKYLPTVSYYLGTAFDTTLLALGLSAVAVFYMSWLLKREEQLLSSIDTLCFDGLCASFQEHSTASRDIVQAIGDLEKQVSERMNGNRGEVVAVMRDELPLLVASELSGQLSAALEQVEASLGKPLSLAASEERENVQTMLSRITFLLEQLVGEQQMRHEHPPLGIPESSNSRATTSAASRAPDAG